MAAKKQGKAALTKVKKHGIKYVKKHGKRLAQQAWAKGKGLVKRVCGKGRGGKCVELIAKHGGKLLQQGSGS